MANVTLSVTDTTLNVSTTTSNITVTDSDGGQTFNVSTISSNINVTAPVTNVIVSQSSGVSNSDVRLALTAVDAGGLGSFTYDNINGVFTYTGVSDSDIRTLFSNTSPITYNSSTGVFGIDSSALFTGKTTDDLAEGSTNKYFTAARVRGNVSAVDAGGFGSFTYDSGTGAFTYTGTSESDVRTALSAVNSPSGSGIYGSLSYSNTTGVFTFTGVTNTEIRNQFTGVSPITFSTVTGNIGLSATANITTSGNISGGYLFGNGSLLTGTYGNTNVANFLANGFGSNSILTSGNITSTGNVTAGIINSGRFLTTDYYHFNSNDKPIRLQATVTELNPNGALITNHQNSPAANESKITIQSNNVTIDVGAFSSTGRFVVKDSSISPNTGTPMLQVGAQPNNAYLDDVRTWGDIRVGTATFGDNSGNIILKRIGQIEFPNNDGVIGGLSYLTTSGNVTANYFLGNGAFLTGITSVSNAQVVSYIATQPLTVGGNLTVNGNINATGNINVQNVEDLYVRDQTIVLNANAASPANVQIVSNRPGSANTELKWNEQSTRWTFTNDGTTYYNLATSTTDVPEGANLYFSNARVNAFIQNNITTTDIDEGANLYYTTGRANTAIDNRVTKTFVEGLGVSYTSLTDKPVIPTHTSNLVNDSGFITTANANVVSVNGQTGVVSLTTTNIAEGANLYYTTDRANTAIGAYQGTINTAGNITTSANVSGQYILGNGAFLTGITGGTGNYGDSNVTTLLGNLGSNVISSTANITTSANVVANVVASQINHPQPFGAILMNSIFVDELAIGRNPTNRIFISNYGGETVSQGQYLRISNTSPQTATFENFGLSFSNIGTFGNVSAGDPANISYSQDTASVVRAGLSGNVGDITVTGVGSGDTGWIIIAQDATGGRQLTLGSAWKMEGCTTGNPVNIARGSNEETLMFWTHDGTYYRATLHPNIGSNTSVNIKTTGNVEGNYFIGNGALLTGITGGSGNYGDSNVTTLLANFGSNVISSAANITINAGTQVNVGANLVANASVITVTNGSNFIPNAERNLGLTIDRNNNTANASASVVTGSSIAYRGGFSPDRIVFSSTVDGYFDGQPVTISGFTDPTLAGALNGNVFYLRMRPALPGTYDIYSNPALTTAVNLAVGNLTGTTAGPGTITFTRRNSVTPKEWAMNLDQVSNDLRIKEDGTTRVTVASGGNVDITGTANANAIIVNQPGTAGTYANTALVDASPGILTGGSFGDVSNVSNVFVSIFNSGQLFPVGSPFQLTFTGVTGPGNININGQTFYSNGFDAFGDASAVQLFTDAAATTPANAVVIGILPGNGTGSGNVSFTFTAGSAGSNWKLSTNGKLNFSLNGVEKANIDSAGNISTSANVIAGNTVVNGVAFNTAGTTSPSSGQIVYNSNYGTHQAGLSGSNVMLLGQDLVVYANNGEANTLLKGEVVYISGATGDKATVKRATNNSDNNSATTIGIVKSDIVSGGLGYIVSQGVVDGINLGAYTAGDKLYLGNVAGTFTNVKPESPAHYVFIGVVERANSGNGQILVRVQNGFELDEIHDVKLTNIQQNDMLIRNVGNSLWVNQSVSSVVANTNVTLKQFSETRVALGNVTGDQSSNINLANGSIFTMTATGNITISSVTNAVAGSSATLIITQDGSGNRLLTSTMKFAGASKTLSTAAGAIDIVSLFYDGTTYYATLSKGYA